MVLMETIELWILQAKSETESNDIAQSLHADIVGVKDNKTLSVQKSPIINEKTATTIKKHLSSGNDTIANIQRWLQWVVLFMILQVWGIWLYHFIQEGVPFWSQIAYWPTVGIIAWAVLVRSFTRKASIGVKIGALVILSSLTIIAINMITL
jgi:hypothetical protein